MVVKPTLIKSNYCIFTLLGSSIWRLAISFFSHNHIWNYEFINYWSYTCQNYVTSKQNLYNYSGYCYYCYADHLHHLCFHSSFYGKGIPICIFSLKIKCIKKTFLKLMVQVKIQFFTHCRRSNFKKWWSLVLNVRFNLSWKDVYI